MNNSNNLFEALYRYKMWANNDIFTLIKTVDALKHKDELHTIIRIMNHTLVVDQIFSSHLTSIPHAHKATNTEDTPSLEDLIKAVKISDDWYLQYVSELTSSDLNEIVNFQFTDGDSGSMTKQEILMHIINHGSYHRGAAGRILAQLSITPPKDTFTAFIHHSEPHRRAKN